MFVFFENHTYTIMAPQNCSSLSVNNWSTKTIFSCHLWLCLLWWMFDGHFICTIIKWYWVWFVDGTGPVYACRWHRTSLHTFITNKSLITSRKEGLSCLFVVPCSCAFWSLFFPKISSRTPWPLKMGLIGCPKTSVTIYQSRLYNIPGEQRPHI
jgi:hypothetical protein